MPIIASAIKKLRQDKKRQDINVKARDGIKRAVKVMRKTPSADNLKLAFSALDTAAKKNLLHKNKAARLKSNLSKLIASSQTK